MSSSIPECSSLPCEDRLSESSICQDGNRGTDMKTAGSKAAATLDGRERNGMPSCENETRSQPTPRSHCIQPSAYLLPLPLLWQHCPKQKFGEDDSRDTFLAHATTRQDIKAEKGSQTFEFESQLSNPRRGAWRRMQLHLAQCLAKENRHGQRLQKGRRGVAAWAKSSGVSAVLSRLIALSKTSARARENEIAHRVRTSK